MAGGIRLPLATLDNDYHKRVEAALEKASAIPRSELSEGGSVGWPSRDVLLKGHLFDAGLINQALEIIEKRGGDFEILSFAVQPNDQKYEFNTRRLSSCTLRIYGVDVLQLDDITSRLQSLAQVLESAEGSVTVLDAVLSEE